MNMLHQLTLNDQTPLEYFSLGQGQALVFIHGVLGDWRTFQPHCYALSPYFHCISYTQRYFGIQTKVIESHDFGVERHLQDLVQLCVQLNLKQIVLVGWSYSCHIALMAAVRYPYLIKHLLLYDAIVPQYGLTATEQKHFSQDIYNLMRPVSKALKQKHYTLATQRFVAGCASNHTTLEQQSVTLQKIKQDNQFSLDLLLQQTPPTPLHISQLTSLKCHLNVYWGEFSRPTFALPSQALARTIQIQQRACMINHQHHWWPEEDPIGFSNLIRSVISC